MRRAAEWGLGLLAVVLAGAFVVAVGGAGSWRPAPAPRTAPGADYFHGGKTRAAALGGSGCVSGGCHFATPHRRDRTQAPFRNMHVRFVGCPVCHGRDPGTWTVAPAAAASGPATRDGSVLRERWTISAASPPTDRGKGHPALGKALSCRGCHSADGARGIAAKGGRALPGKFEDPVVLRMIEQGAKQWIPDTIR